MEASLAGVLYFLSSRPLFHIGIYLYIYFFPSFWVDSIKLYLLNLVVPFPYSLILLSIINGTLMASPFLIYEKLRKVDALASHTAAYHILLVSLLLFQVIRIFEFYLTRILELYYHAILYSINNLLGIFVINALIWFCWLKLTQILIWMTSWHSFWYEWLVQVNHHRLKMWSSCDRFYKNTCLERRSKIFKGQEN